jgi:hypothetical protein
MSDHRVALDAPGPACPGCQRPIRETLRVDTVEAVDERPGRSRRVEVTSCGACGITLSAVPLAQGPESMAVPDPADPDSVEGRFQARCGELISEIQVVGFMPGGWIGLITNLGAVGAARELLSSGRILPVTPWLLSRGRADLTMEQEITRAEWTDLFDEAERTKARDRLERSAQQP